MPNAESKPKGINGILQDGMSPEGSEKQVHCGYGKEEKESSSESNEE